MSLREIAEYLIELPKIRKPPKKSESLDIIVSLTTIPSRLKIVHLTIKSIKNRKIKPQKIILHLNADLKSKVPKNLLKLVGNDFEIKFSNWTCSHRKLIPTLEAFPEKVIITCDDDLIYRKNWLENLWNDHLNHPKEIITNRCNYISYDKNGNTLPYKQWKKEVKPNASSLSIMPAGYGGVLYPPNCLHSDINNYEIFMNLAPKADDLWFKAMSYLNGTLCRRSSNPGKKPITIPFTQKNSLSKDNIKKDFNREQWNNLRKYYNFKTPDI